MDGECSPAEEGEREREGDEEIIIGIEIRIETRVHGFLCWLYECFIVCVCVCVFRESTNSHGRTIEI